MSLKYLDLCSGIGGMRAGLSRAGWNCVYSADIELDVAKVHKLAFGHCNQQDILDIKADRLPKHDVIVAGFPCQPFSSSGIRSGFQHSSGNVFEAVADLVEFHNPKAVILENVQGLLSNQNGFSMATILRTLSSMDYATDWAVLNTSWFGVPQHRPRLFLISRRIDLLNLTKSKISYELRENSVFKSIFAQLSSSLTPLHNRSVSSVLRERKPTGRAKNFDPITPFGPVGSCVGDNFSTYSHHVLPTLPYMSLGEICSPRFARGEAIRSVRYWGHSGETKPYVKKEPISHCIGTNIGAGPTFCVPEKELQTRKDKDALLEFANWTRSQNGMLMFRITPERALKLFGPYTAGLARALQQSSVTSTRKYEMIGNLVSPSIAFVVANLLNGWFKTLKQRDREIDRATKRQNQTAGLFT